MSVLRHALGALADLGCAALPARLVLHALRALGTFFVGRTAVPWSLVFALASSVHRRQVIATQTAQLLIAWVRDAARVLDALAVPLKLTVAAAGHYTFKWY